MPEWEKRAQVGQLKYSMVSGIGWWMCWSLCFLCLDVGTADAAGSLPGVDVFLPDFAADSKRERP